MSADVPTGSVTYWIGQLKAGEKAATQKLWEGYFGRLVGLARARMRTSPRQGKDEEDVAVSAFDSFFRAVEAGRFPNLEDRDDLWQILVMLAGRKATSAARNELAQKRGGGAVRAASQLASPDGECPLAGMIGRDPEPAEAAGLAEEYQRLLELLPEELLREIALFKLEGLTNDEIARRTGRSTPTIERKLKRIRETWKAEALARGVQVD